MLRLAGLDDLLPPRRVFGQDSPELVAARHEKAGAIAWLRALPHHDWPADAVLFVDDSKEHIERASETCRTLLVESKATVGGMGKPELDTILASAPPLPPATT